MLRRTRQLAKDLYHAYHQLQRDRGTQMAAAVAYYMAVSFFPLLLVLISLTGFVLRFTGWGQDAQQRLIDLIADQSASTLAQQVEAVLANVQDNAAVGGPVGLLTLILAAMAVFVHFDDAMDRIWNVRPSSRSGIIGSVHGVVIDRLRAFVMLLGVAAFLVAGFAASMSLTIIGESATAWLPLPAVLWELLTLVFGLVLNVLLFMVIYKMLPKVPVNWKEAARGACVASVLWEIGRRLLAALVIGSKFSVYGIVGGFIAIMLWMFYATMILFLGAEFIQVGRRQAIKQTGGAGTVYVE